MLPTRNLSPPAPDRTDMSRQTPCRGAIALAIVGAVIALAAREGYARRAAAMHRAATVGWRHIAGAALATLIVAACGSSVPAAQRSAPGGLGFQHTGVTIQVGAAGRGLTCRLPISLMSRKVSGFVTFRHGTATFVAPAPLSKDSSASGPLYLSAFKAWVLVPRANVSPDGRSYAQATPSVNGSSTTITISRVKHEHVTWQFNQAVGIMGWTPEGILLMDLHNTSAFLLDPATGVSRAFPLASNLIGAWLHYLPAGDSVWSQSSHAGDAQIVSQSVATDAERTWYSSSSGYAYSVATTPAGTPLVQTSNSAVQLYLVGNEQVGISQEVLLMGANDQPTIVNQGTIGSPGIVGALNPATFTSASGIWMSDGLGGIWRYTLAHGLQEIARVSDHEQVESVSLAGSCQATS